MNEQTLARLLAEYETAELRLTGIIANYVMLGLDDEQIAGTWAAIKLNQIKNLAADTKQVLQDLKGLDTTAARLVIDAYQEGLKIISGGIVGTNVAAGELLAQDLVSKLITSRFQILRKTIDAYRQIIGNVEGQTALGVNTRIQAARQALSLFADKGIVSFVDNAGKQWSIASYTEMATRTATNNALREGRLQGLSNNDKDLIIVSSVPNPSELCVPYERKILSISGKDTRYDSLAAAKANGLYHPNCRHSFARYIPGVTEIGKTDADKGFDDYDDMQRQREIERNVRRWKRRLVVASDDKSKQKAKSKIAEWKDTLEEHLVEHDSLTEKPSRLSNVAAR
jgi:minor capsid protein 2